MASLSYPAPMTTARAKRALERQLAYQEVKARAMPEDTRPIELDLTAYAREVRGRIEKHRRIEPGARVLEVGSGAHGLVFFLGLEGAIGVDPLANEYAKLFPAWQSRAKTIAAYGEALPFEDGAFDVVLSDNVVDHAESPARIVRELARVLAPGGILYFTVHVHHPVYGAASRLFGASQAVGIPVEVGPFADHTVHLTLKEARGLFDGLGLRVLHEETGIADAMADAKTMRPRHLGDRLKRLFFKNARFELVASRDHDHRR
jgi:SAM-dependent methyltransferase